MLYNTLYNVKCIVCTTILFYPLSYYYNNYLKELPELINKTKLVHQTKQKHHTYRHICTYTSTLHNEHI